MIIQPAFPDSRPDGHPASSVPTLPFRRSTDFRELLQSRMRPAATPEPVSHVVQKGESLWRICADALKAQGGATSKNAINQAVDRVTKSNGLKNPNILAVGQNLNLSALRGDASFMTSKLDSSNASNASLSKLASKTADARVAPLVPAKVSSEPLAPLRPMDGPRGGGVPPARMLFSKLSNARPINHDHRHSAAAEAAAALVPKNSVDLTALMQSILEPGSVAVNEPKSESPWAKLLGGSGRFTSGFGVRNDPFSGKPQFHQGIDIAAASGTEIYPYQPGVVKSSGWNPGRGNFVAIEHPNGMETIYAHASETLVKAGDVVMKDTPIAKVGSTGRSTGPHLHFEVRQNDKAIDPLPFVKDNSLNIAKAP